MIIPREEVFHVKRDGRLAVTRLPRTRTTRERGPYTHHATLQALDAVAWAIEEAGEAGVTTNELWDAIPDIPTTQISVALAFLVDRGVAEREGRRNRPTTDDTTLEARLEYHALEHEGSQEITS